jgi:hypothetical protein
MNRTIHCNRRSESVKERNLAREDFSAQERGTAAPRIDFRGRLRSDLRAPATPGRRIPNLSTSVPLPRQSQKGPNSSVNVFSSRSAGVICRIRERFEHRRDLRLDISLVLAAVDCCSNFRCFVEVMALHLLRFL